MLKDNDPLHIGTAEDLQPDAAAEARAEAERARKEADELIEQASFDRARKELKKANEDNTGLFDDDAQSGISSLFGKKDK